MLNVAYILFPLRLQFQTYTKWIWGRAMIYTGKFEEVEYKLLGNYLPLLYANG